MNYNPETGQFNWIVNKRRVKIGDPCGNPSHGYIRIRLNNKGYAAHRLAWLYQYGVFPDKQIDHINGIRCDNRIINLRLANNSENQCNVKLPVTNTTGYKNVHLHRCGLYVVRIKKDKITYNLGYFKTAEEANEVAVINRRILHGQYARE